MALGELQPGTVFAHDYRIARLLSTGGMGAVYVAEQLSTNKERALKLMRPELVSDADLRRRFEQEARVSAKIASDHIVEIVGAGVDDGTGLPWLAMELLEGEELFDLAERVGTLDPESVRAMFEQLCHALAAAHALKIVHRDMKPENIFLAKPRRPGVPFTVKVLDFGIAKTLADAEARATQSLGTPLWMAPEQTTQGAAITPAADVWALGLIAFRLLAGRYYWKSAYDQAKSTAMLLREVLIDPMVPASQRSAQLGALPLPAGFDAWFAQCTARDPSARFQEAGALYDGLAALLSGAATQLSAPVITSIPIAMAATAYATPAPFPGTSFEGTGQPVSVTAPSSSVVKSGPHASVATPQRRTSILVVALGIFAAIVVVAGLVTAGMRAQARSIRLTIVHRIPKRGDIVKHLPSKPRAPSNPIGPPGPSHAQ